MIFRSKITFKSLTDTVSFNVDSENKELVERFVYGLYEIFGDIENKKIYPVQKNNKETKEKVIEFLTKFKEKFPPSLNQIIAYFNRMEINQDFLFLPNTELTPEVSFKLHNLLLSLRDGIDYKERNKDYDNGIGKTMKKYDLRAFGTTRRFFGNKNNKRCRFCNKTESETTFKNKAHAISEGLGNKKLFLYDECDKCNDKFSIEIEPDLINYFSIFRSFFRVNGKGGIKKIKGKNFEIINDDRLEIKFKSIKDRSINEQEYNLNLNLQKKINSQDIYRCLAKYAISLMDDSLLIKFESTIKWINKEIKIEKLPRIGELISYQHFTTEPKLFLYIRKGNNKKLPFVVCEFHYTCKLMTFILPLCDEDEIDFTDINNFEKFWKNFHHYTQVKGWVFNDYSTDKDRDFTFKLNFNKEES